MSRLRHHPLRLLPQQNYESDRHATWLELFFDLVFVLAIAELAHMLHGDLTWTGIVSFAILFVPVWWLWIDFSYFADQFNIERGIYRVILLGTMFGLIVMALSVSHALDGGSARFAIIYTILRFIITALYIQAWRTVPPFRSLTRRYATSFSISLVLWVFSIFVPEPARFWLWAIALTIEIGNGPITYLTVRDVPAQNSHMDERFGLFTIIVLGEAIVAVAAGVAGTNWGWQSVLLGASGFVIAVSFWWMYFERADESAINQALKGSKMALLRSYVYGYSHVFAFMGIAMTSVGIQVAIETTPNADLSFETRTILCGGIAIFLIGVTLLQWASPCSLPRKAILLRICLAILSLCLISPISVLSPVGLVLLLSISLVSLNWQDGVSLPEAKVS
ncbi:low temperature requirement protein LtrA [Synechococcus sp. PCC 7335]|uniref:low temperature requirement protein A n=1 Tax=Synechococcus sp. (strain ATCC 29403 / PCC 7335) TaxID=91464 RepID=UPI00017EB814|nr:low temperature requirement protein A [Synechococcus sp. PCC 7335]EDX85852.1 low temperature requirement protein LtrA [Synechococcus sp. PCC 7335]